MRNTRNKRARSHTSMIRAAHVTAKLISLVRTAETVWSSLQPEVFDKMPFFSEINEIYLNVFRDI